MFDEPTLLENAIEAWMRHHRMTYSFLDQLSEEQLYAKLPRPGLDSFAKHYEEMADVQMCYAEALGAGRLDFSRLSPDKPYQGKSTRAELETAFKRADQAMLEGAWNCPSDRVIDIFGNRCSRGDLVQTLLHHELFHQGQFFIFAQILKFDVPKDWRDFWWIPQQYPEAPR
jgi:uncharacterized damage-inducible protein DinB